MLVAAFLSDLKSLSVSSDEAALNLVSIYSKRDEKAGAASKESEAQSTTTVMNVDKQRADDLVTLHQAIKVRHSHGTDMKLLKAKEDVRKVLQDLS